MQVRIITQPTGLFNGSFWPAAGETADLPDVVATDLLASGYAEVIKAEVETRPDKTSKVETATVKTTRKR